MKKIYSLDGCSEYYALSPTNFCYTIRVTMNNSVNANFINNAVISVLNDFAYYRVMLRKGLFRSYFIYNENEFIVQNDKSTVIENIDAKSGSYLLKVIYDNNTINFIFSHILCDGIGALSFAKSCMYRYFNINADIEIMKFTSENAYKPYNKGKGYLADTKDYFKFAKTTKPAIYHLKTSTKHILKLAKALNVSLTAFILYAMHKSIAITDNSYGTAPIKWCIPVNLRKRLNVNTAYNFSSSLEFTMDAYIKDARNYAQHISSLISHGINNIEQTVNYANTLHSFPLNILPTKIKESFLQNPNESKEFINVSNLGLAKFHHNEIKNIEFILPPSVTSPISAAILTYENTTNINIASMYDNDEFFNVFKSLMTVAE